MKFAVIADTHIVVPGTYPDGVWWNKTLYSMAERRYSSIIRSISSMNPDFVAVCGDLTGDTKTESFLLAKKLMDALPCEWRTAVGNHDTNWPGVREEVSKLYGLASNINYYSYDLHGNNYQLHFIFLDLCWNLWRDGTIRPHIEYEAYRDGDILKFGVDDTQLQWIENELNSNKNKSIILVSHTPIYYKNEVIIGTLPKGLKIFNAGYPLNKLNPELEEKSADRLKQLISKYKDSIKIVFSGHTHVNEVIFHEGIPFCTTGSLRECPFEFRMVEVKSNYLHVTTHPLDDPILFEASYEKWRNNDWINGEESDRNFVVNL
jgi:3',5'-cyclic AMP phosphodiesterase CpdA